MKGRNGLAIALIAVAAGSGWSSPAPATDPPPNGTLYRCKAPNGEVRFTNIAAPGCVVLGTYQPKSVTSSLPDQGVREKDGWVILVMGSKEEVRWNPTRTKFFDGNLLTWLMFRYPKPQSLSAVRYRKFIAQSYIDCESGSMTMNVGYWYDSDAISTGNLVDSSDRHSREVPPPGSIGDEILQSLCDASAKQ